MPYTDTQPSLPWQGKTVTSRHCSERAAVSASQTRVWKSARYLTWLRDVRTATDWGAADHFGWPLSTVCSVRNHCVDRGLVAAVGTCEGRYGKKVTLWQAAQRREEAPR